MRNLLVVFTLLLLLASCSNPPAVPQGVVVRDPGGRELRFPVLTPDARYDGHCGPGFRCLRSEPHDGAPGLSVCLGADGTPGKVTVWLTEAGVVPTWWVGDSDELRVMSVLQDGRLVEVEISGELELYHHARSASLAQPEPLVVSVNGTARLQV